MHLRGKWPEYKNLIWDKEDYLFTVFSDYKNDTKIILFKEILAEYMVFKNSINKTLSNIVKQKII